jgi:hypothetical protein
MGSHRDSTSRVRSFQQTMSREHIDHYGGDWTRLVHLVVE